MKHYFSKSTSAFYVDTLHANSIPSDAVEITAAEKKAVFEQLKASPWKELSYDANGKPLVIDSPAPVATLLERAKTELRTMRAPMLDALSGIAGRAVRAGNDELAAEADALAVLLLDITDDKALNAATTYEEMQAAGVAAYKRIASAASPALSIVFKEITGA